MTTYLDTSVVVAVIVDEPRSAAIRTWVGQSAETMIISDLTALEIRRCDFAGRQDQSFR